MSDLLDRLRRRRRGAAVPAARGLLARRAGPIGLEIGRERLTMVQLGRRDGGPVLRAVASVAHPGPRAGLVDDGGALRPLVREALGRARFVGRRVVGCVPPEDVRLVHLTYTAADPDGEDRAVLGQALERVGGEAADWVVDYVPARRREAAGAERAALAACAPRERIERLLDALSGAGLDVEALEIGPAAIARLVTRMAAMRGVEPGNVLVVNIGEERSYLTVHAEGGLILDREVRIGEADLLERVAAGLEVGPEEARALAHRHGLAHAALRLAAGAGPVAGTGVAGTLTEIVRPRLRDLAAEVEKAVIYTASQLRGAAIDRVGLLGSLARWPGADAVLNGLLDLPVEVLDPLAVFARAGPPGDGLRHAGGGASLAVATGCALRGVD